MYDRLHMPSSGAAAAMRSHHSSASPRRQAAAAAGGFMSSRTTETGTGESRAVHGGLIQRKCAACAQQEEGVHRTAIATVQRVLAKSGSPMGEAERTTMESRFGHSFGGVRIHTDAESAQSAQALSARAYTVGNNIVFGKGEYRPHSAEGRQLLAHELVHTIQQGGQAGAVQTSLRVGAIDSPAEREADMIAQRVAGNNADSVNVHASVSERGVLHRFPICAAWLFPPGKVIFEGLTAQTQKDFAVMPEDGSDLILNPQNGVKYDTDGFWHRHHSPKSQWYKIPSHCRAEIKVSGTSFSAGGCCNALGIGIQEMRGRQSTPGWSSDSHATTNPF